MVAEGSCTVKKIKAEQKTQKTECAKKSPLKHFIFPFHSHVRGRSGEVAPAQNNKDILATVELPTTCPSFLVQ